MLPARLTADRYRMYDGVPVPCTQYLGLTVELCRFEGLEICDSDAEGIRIMISSFCEPTQLYLIVFHARELCDLRRFLGTGFCLISWILDATQVKSYVAGIHSRHKGNLK